MSIRGAGRCLDQRRPRAEFCCALKDMNSPVRPAHEGGYLFELFRSLVELRRAVAADVRNKAHTPILRRGEGKPLI